MTYANAAAKGLNNREGDLYQFFQEKVANLVQVNGGDHYFNWKTFECFDSNCPHPVRTKSYLRLTSENFPITQMEKSFISIRIKLSVKLDKTLTGFDIDKKRLVRVFIGLKNSAEFFGKLDTICNNIMCKNTQDEAVREQFAYNCLKPRAEKATAKFSHSTWNNVASFSESVCGIYVPLAELADGFEHSYNMELVIPYTDLLKYQAFMLYPNAICGEIKELVETSTDAFVWAPISPTIVKDSLETWTGDVMSIKLPDYYGITNKFTQCGNAAGIISSITKVTEESEADIPEKLLLLQDDSKYTYGVSNVTLSITNCIIEQMRTNIAGFAVKARVLEQLRQLLQKPVVIPSQTLDRRHFPNAAGANGIDTTTDISLNSATNITVVFPKNSNDATCFDNIMYENVQLFVNKHAIPDTELQTIGARFYQLQLVANELDGPLEATKEFENSFTDALNNMDENSEDFGKRRSNCRADGTSFGINFQLERSNAGYVFDGADFGTQTVPITFRGKPMFKGNNDTYYNYLVNDDGSVDTIHHPPPPELWICQDTYFTMDAKNGLVYHGIHIPQELY